MPNNPDLSHLASAQPPDGGQDVSEMARSAEARYLGRIAELEAELEAVRDFTDAIQTNWDFTLDQMTLAMHFGRELAEAKFEDRQRCDGTGTMSDWGPKQCTHCGGSGKRWLDQSAESPQTDPVRCQWCGSPEGTPCPAVLRCDERIA